MSLLKVSTHSSSVDNIYVGHDAAEAKAFAKETYHVKKPIEQEAEGSKEDSDDDDESSPSRLLDKIRLRIYEFTRQLSMQFGHPNKADEYDRFGWT